MFQVDSQKYRRVFDKIYFHKFSLSPNLAKSSCGFAIALARGVATVDGYALSGWKSSKI
jgi:hypothetical protein